jgi:hypothetical protein
MSDGIKVKVDFPELKKLQDAFKTFRPNLAKKHMGAAIRRSLKPGTDALKQTTPKGPTGNLRNAITSKVKTYVSGNAVGLVGYMAAGSGKSKSAGGGKIKKGKDRAFHAGFLEFGTRERVIKTSSRRAGASVASSFRTLGPFKINRPAKRGKFAGSTRVTTKPKYPKAFFKKAPRGEILSLREMPKGGSLGNPPVRTAYTRSLPTMRSKLSVEMTKSLLNAQKDLADKFPPKRND